MSETVAVVFVVVGLGLLIGEITVRVRGAVARRRARPHRVRVRLKDRHRRST